MKEYSIIYYCSPKPRQIIIELFSWLQFPDKWNEIESISLPGNHLVDIMSDNIFIQAQNFINPEFFSGWWNGVKIYQDDNLENTAYEVHFKPKKKKFDIPF